MHVTFNPHDKSLDALMKLSYTNHSPDTLLFIWFHLWPNAYRNDRTQYSEQLLENGDTRFYFSRNDQKGYLNRLEFRVDGAMANIQDHPEYLDIVKLVLPKPLLPGDSVSITSTFHERIPFNFNGFGYNGQHYEIRNWYPEPAVYDSYGWHPMPYLVQGGDYHEAANYQVEIETPSAYRIAAAAVPDTFRLTNKNIFYRFSLDNTNSFAWMADTNFQLKTNWMEISPGNYITIQYYYKTAFFDEYNGIFEAAKKYIRQLSEWLGPYPYPTITLVQSVPPYDQNFSGMLCIGNYYKSIEWDAALRKALACQWFQTILLSDQRNHPWLSKGFISYYEERLLAQNPQLYPVKKDSFNNYLWLRVAEKEKTTQPIATSTPVFSAANDSLVPGVKAGLWIRRLNDSLGNKLFDLQMQNYFARWKFGHPYPDDFKTGIDTNIFKKWQPYFDQLNGKESLFPEMRKRSVKAAFIFSARNSYRNNYIGLAPIAGYNRYDDFMLGALIHNINLPENNFEFLFIPLYAFGSKKVEGLERISYSWHPGNQLSKIVVGMNGSRFASNKATDSTGRMLFESWSKLVPYVRIEFKPSNPRSSIKKWIDFKTYLITENKFEQFNIYSKDSMIHPNAMSSSFRYVNQLSFNMQNNRTLYPYDTRISFQQSESFYRINVEAGYFFNFAQGGGMRVRFFAAKFGVWNNNNNTDLSRYQPKLLGVNGEEDFLYEGYFIGRSASDAYENISVPNGGYMAQQIMNRDGGIKLRTDAYPDLQGKSANWVSSFNFSTTLPNKLFPFSLPLRIYFDVGTYAEAWHDNAETSRFLYDCGVQLSLFKNLLNIYAPLFYSNDFNSALGNISYGRRITFSIDIQNINYKKMISKAAGS